ncbi:hypothetical protein NQ317_006692 [Molorchus minor]|uniref:F-box domain-containing protein n=1 Tax=Molorchus minor TaxID=1323400 RepID=A0ABQ9JTA5_9CUCU|nr:hypothetical protein NQ317_006692 [Molorchus minor]
MSGKNMASSWQDLIPIELLTEIYKYLPRCDRLSCSMVCQMWKEALNRKSLWKKIVLCIDKDFLGVKVDISYRIQTKLEKLVFHNTNLPKTECLKILDACMGSRNTVEYLEIHNYFYNFNTAFDTDEFVDYLRKFAYLKELKVDYFIFSANKVIDTIAENGRNHLKSVEIFIDETDIHSSIVPDRKWRKLKKCCPKVKVSISIKNICHYEQIRFIFLMKNIPLNSFSMHIGSKYNQKRSRSFEETLTHLLGNYWKTLEFINLDIKNNKENIDDLLFQIVRNCPRLKRFLFDGIINEDMNVLCEICRYKQTARGKLFYNL